MYGVFSDEGGTITLHSAFKEPSEALVTLVRYIFFKNYGDVPYGVLHQIAETVERVLLEGNKDSLAVRVNQIEWYVEKLSEELLRDIGQE